MFWSSVKSLLRDIFNKEQNSIHPNTWKPHFRSLLNNVNIDSNKLEKEKEKPKSLEIGMANKIGELDSELKEKEILDAIKTLKNNKSKFGPVSNEMLKCNPKAIIKTLCSLFNYILKSKTFLEIWNLSLIKPIQKSGTTTLIEHYRGICISNHLSKLFTSVLCDRLQSWVSQKGILPEKSLGFRKGLRTEDGLFILTSLLDKYVRKGQKLYACFVDFAKFYDTIAHDLLFLKLAEKGVNGNFYYLLKNMYQNCKYAVKVQLNIENADNKYKKYKWFRTTCFKAVSGLKQGCNLSPLLANIYLSDLHEHLEQNHNFVPILSEESVTSVTWADDLLILSLHRDGLQNCLGNLNSYTQKWGLEVSLKKTRCVIFSKGHTNYALQNPFLIGRKILQFENFYKYLGVEIMNNCAFTMVKRERVIKAKKAFNMLRPLLSTTGNVSVKLTKILFESKIEPILTYGSIIWASENNTNTVLIRGLHKKYLTITNKNVRNQINNFLGTLWDGYCPQLDLVKTLGKKKDTDRPILIKFTHFHDKEKLLFDTANIPDEIQVQGNSKNNGC